jgi:signal transduction histidine kinase
VTVEPLPLVQGNQKHLVRVFQNLIANAIKYRGAAPARIHVTAERLGTEWIIKVRDNGIGIPPEHYERVFRLFKRLHGPETPGAGIGLAICKKIVEAMGGAIWIEPAPGSGSIFCFTITAESDRSTISDIAFPGLVFPERSAPMGIQASPVTDVAQPTGLPQMAGSK